MRRASIAIATAACLACGLFAAAASDAASAAPTARASRAAAVASALPAQIAVGGGSRRIPTSFFGLSLEYKELHTYVKSGALFRRMLSIVRPRDGSPMVLRIGGKSADHVWWGTTEKPPQWVTTLGEQWLSRLSGLVSRADLKVMLDLNLAVHSPTMAARFAKAAVQALPSSSVAGFEVENEPDLYWRQPWLEKQRIATTSERRTPALDRQLLADRLCQRDYEAYARAVMTAAPGIPLGGPEIISSKADWLTAPDRPGPAGARVPVDPPLCVVHLPAAELSALSDDPVDALRRLVVRVARTTQGAVEFAHANHTQLRLTEINSISCGGKSGSANSFATALWAPDVLFELVNAGVDGINWHIRPSTLNAPFNLDQGKLVPLPELYGLAVFAQMTHGPARLVDTTVSRPRPAWT